MPEIVISEFMDEAAIRDAFAGRDVLYDPQLVDDATRLHEAVRDARALIVRNRTQVRGSLLDAAVKLEVVGRLGVGLDNIDVAACAARGLTGFRMTDCMFGALAIITLVPDVTLFLPRLLGYKG